MELATLRGTVSLRAWIQASRPLAQANIAVPLLLGEMLAFVQCMRLDIGLLIVAHAFGILDQLFIVWANDLADEEADRANEAPTLFSGGSRVLVQGLLTRRQLARAAAGAAMAMLALSIYTAVAMDRPAMPLAWAMAIALLWVYSFPPGRLSYRGAGAITQAFGVMVALPMLGFYLQCGDIRGFPWPALVACFALGLAGNITTALPDHPADEQTGKATWAVRYGPARARKHSLQLIALGAVCTPLVVPDLPKLGWACIQALPILLVAFNARALASAEASNRKACLRFVVINGAAINLTIIGWIVALALRPPWGW
ncbi:MAG: prenyltransferase [Deltaproteobacteria bacterium]|nr:prenyltransferase [Deltaproteobacteria bacterium]